MRFEMPEPIRTKSSMKQDRFRREIQDKYERSLFTPSGMKVFRLQPSIDNTSILKYQSRPSSTASSTVTSPRHTYATHTPAPPPQRSGSAGSTGSRPQTMKSIGTQTSLERAACAGAVREKPPVPASAHRPGSSLSNRSVTYNSRSTSCQPSRMYQNENIRSTAKLNRPPSKVYPCQEHQDRVHSAGSTKSPTRFDGSPVEIPGFMRNNEFLCHEDLNMGQKQYIWGVARIYSVSQLMNLKQRQYQNLLDYEFSRRIQNKELKEHERVKEWKDYKRYSKFIKRYEQRIPRNRPGEEKSPCEEASHIHKHMIKGWTTNPSANDAYRPSSAAQPTASPAVERRPTSRQGTEDGESTDTDTEYYRLKVVVLSGDKDKTGADNDRETGKEESTAANQAQQDDEPITHHENDDSEKSLHETDLEKKAELSNVEENAL